MKSQASLSFASAGGAIVGPMDIDRGLRIPIYGLGCGGSIERELASSYGVLRVYVNPATETAYVDYDPAEIDAWALARVIERAGIEPAVRSRPERCICRP